jgi:hypothetical protein
MSPESSVEIVVLDLYWDGDQLRCKFERVAIDEEIGLRLRLSWNLEAPSGYFPIGGGVAYVCQTHGINRYGPDEGTPTSLGEGCYRWSEWSDTKGLVFVLVLPDGFTVADRPPRPALAKQFGVRIALLWRFHPPNGQQVNVEWELRPISDRTELKTAVDNLNRAASAAGAPNITGPIVEDVFGPVEMMAALRRELAQQQRTLALLKQQKAVFATGESPVSLLNQIQSAEGEIRRIQLELVTVWGN